MGRRSVCPFTTVTAALAVPTAVSPAHAVAVTVWAPTATLSVPENVPPASRARSAERPAGATCTETRVISRAHDLRGDGHVEQLPFRNRTGAAGAEPERGADPAHRLREQAARRRRGCP